MRTSSMLFLFVMVGEASADKETARAHYEVSKKAFDLSDWDTAIRELQTAHQQHPDPAYLFNLAQAYRLKGDCLAAFDQYKAFLREPSISEEQGRYAQGFVDDIAPCARRRRAEIQDAHRIAAMPVPVERHRRGTRLAGYITMGAGLVSVAAGAMFLVRADRASDRVSRALAVDPVIWTDVLEEDERIGRRDNKLGIAFVAIGGAALVGGGVLWWSGRTRIETIVIEPSASGATGSVTWSF
jgi:tetratricopeptide (TPR) repeat protein